MFRLVDCEEDENDIYHVRTARESIPNTQTCICSGAFYSHQHVLSQWTNNPMVIILSQCSRE